MLTPRAGVRRSGPLAVVLLGLVAGATCLASSTAAFAAVPAGSLDPTFDTDGKVTTDISDDHGAAVALQPNGKIIVAGTTGSSCPTNTDCDFLVTRYNPNGSLDASFGLGGGGTIDFGGNDRATAVAIDSAGRIVVAGYTAPAGVPCSPEPTQGGCDLAVARVTAAGSASSFLDSSFSGDGLATLDLGYTLICNSGTGICIPGVFYGGLAAGVATDPTGAVLVAGTSGNTDSTCCDGLLARFTPSGAPDPSISPGIETSTVGWRIPYAGRFQALTTQSDGRILVAGGGVDFTLGRFNANLSVDSSFGSMGRTTDFGATDTANALALDSSGRVVLAGTSGTTFALARNLLADGALDLSFDSDGKQTTSFGGASETAARGVALEPDGRIVAAGRAGNDFALARYNAGGSLDLGFDADGKVTTNFGASSGANGVVVQPDGNIVAAGTRCSASNCDFALARYEAGPPDTVIDSGPGGAIATSSASFGFHGNPGADTAKLQCNLDSAGWQDCTSPRAYSNLADGAHTAAFRAVDANGNADPTPAERGFTVDASSPTGGGGGETTTNATPDTDSTAPELSLTSGKRQRLGRFVKVTAACPTEPCSLQAGGRLLIRPPRRDAARRSLRTRRLRLGRASGQSDGSAVVLRLRIPKRSARVARAALARGARVSARINVGAADGAGNGSSGRVSSRLVGQGQRR